MKKTPITTAKRKNIKFMGCFLFQSADGWNWFVRHISIMSDDNMAVSTRMKAIVFFYTTKKTRCNECNGFLISSCSSF